MEINSNNLKLTGGVELSEELGDLKTNKIIGGEISVYSVTYLDNNDGTLNRVYKAKFFSDVQVSDGSKKILAKDKTKHSVKNRLTIMNFADELGEDREGFYDIFNEKLRANIPEVWEVIKSK